MAIELVFKHQGSSRPPVSNYRNRNHRKALFQFKDEVLKWHKSGLTAQNILENLKRKSNGQCAPSKGQLDAELRHWGLSRYVKRGSKPNMNRDGPKIPPAFDPKPEPCTKSMFSHCLRQARKAYIQSFAMEATSVDWGVFSVLANHLTNGPNAVMFGSQRLANRQRMLEVVIRCLQIGVSHGILVANMVMMAASHLALPTGPNVSDRENILVHLRGAKAMLACSTIYFDNTGLKDLLVSLIKDLEAPETLDPNHQRRSLVLSSKAALPRRQALQIKLAILGAVIELDSIHRGETHEQSIFLRNCMYFIPRPFRDLVYNPALIRLAKDNGFQFFRERYFKGQKRKKMKTTLIASTDLQEQFSHQKIEDDPPQTRTNSTDADGLVDKVYI